MGEARRRRLARQSASTVRELRIEGSPSRRPDISLHLLVKNGESVVGRLLDGVGPHITEVVAVLNDCTDATSSVLVQKAAEHGLRRCEIVEATRASHPDLYFRDVPEAYQGGRALAGECFPADHTGELLLADWASLRNLGWGLHRGDWRLFLDADDVVDDPGCLGGLCAALDGRGIEVASTKYVVGPGAAGSRERLARNQPHIRWEGVVHERLVGSSKCAHVEGSLVVRDLRDSRGEGLRTPLRNLKVLYRRARSRDWNITTREMMYLAAEALAVMPSLAERLGELACSQSSWAGERAWACVVRGQVAEAAGRLGRAEDLYRASLKEQPGCSAALHLARVCYFRRRWEEVLAACQKSRDVRDLPQPPGGGDVDEVALGILEASALVELGRAGEALALCRAARERFPKSQGLEKFARYVEEEASRAR